MDWLAVALLYPVVETDPFRLGFADEYNTPPDRGAAAPGLLVSAGVAEVGPMELVVGVSGRLHTATWDGVPDDVRMSLWEPGAEVAARWDTEGESARLYGGFGLGPKVEIFRRSWGTSLEVVTGDMYANLGVDLGPERAGGFVEVRATTTPRGDRFYGSGATGSEAFSWEWTAGRVGIVALAGGRFGGG